jgi:hypothetical protein
VGLVHASCDALDLEFLAQIGDESIALGHGGVLGS